MNFRIKKRVQEDPLLEVLRDDAHAAGHLESLSGAAVGGHEFAVESKGDESAFADMSGRLGPRIGREHHVLVHDERGLFLHLHLYLAQLTEITHGSGGDLDCAILAFVAGLDAVIAVILDIHTESLGLEGQPLRRGAGHHRPRRGVTQVDCRGDDAMVRGVDLHEHGADSLGFSSIEMIADQGLVDDDAKLATVAKLCVQGARLRRIAFGDFL